MSNNGKSKPVSGVDPASQQLGAIYAEALLGVTEKQGTTDATVGELDSLVTDLLDRNAQFDQLLATALISIEEKQAMLDRVLGDHISPVLMNFLKVVARHGRLGEIRAIRHSVHERLNQLRGRVRVQVTTAAPLDDPLRQRLADRIRAMLSREPVLETEIDPELIGGIVLRVGDTVYDGSIATQLKRMSEQIISRSVHEIQSRRDRFSYPAGN